MQELIQKLQQEAGLTEEQARQAIQTMKAFVVEKFPMLESAANKLFGE
jgi:nucleoid DNA-binding protein